MAESIKVPIIKWKGDSWAALKYFGESHLICAEDFRMKDQQFTFSGGHRVRLYSVKKNVHWKIPLGVTLDVSDVTPASSPRRLPGR